MQPDNSRTGNKCATIGILDGSGPQAGLDLWAKALVARVLAGRQHPESNRKD